MVITFSQGKIIVTPFEVQVRLDVAKLVLQALVDDIQLRTGALLLVADGGGVRWSLTLDNAEQFELLQSELGIDAL
jgi:hypothetical protein